MTDEQKTVMQPPVETLASAASVDDVEKGKGLAWLSYLGILWLVPMLAAKDNQFCKFHVKQGIMLTIWYIAVGIVGLVPFLGWFIVVPLGYLFGLVLAVVGIVQSATGKYWTMPLLGGMAKNWFKF